MSADQSFVLQIEWDVPDLPNLVGPFVTDAEARRWAGLNVSNGTWKVAPLAWPYMRPAVERSQLSRLHVTTSPPPRAGGTLTVPNGIRAGGCAGPFPVAFPAGLFTAPPEITVRCDLWLNAGDVGVTRDVVSLWLANPSSHDVPGPIKIKWTAVASEPDPSQDFHSAYAAGAR